MSKDVINKELVDHLAELARINLGDDEKKITKDIKEIVGYFEKISGVNIEGVYPMIGGSDLVNVMRKDEYKEEKKLPAKPVIEEFPEKDDGYLKTPPVFE